MSKHLGRGGSERGATLVEFAVVVPLLFLLIFGIVEMSRLIAEFTSIRTAAREGARFATTTEIDAGVPHFRDCSAIIDAARAKSILGDTTQVSVTWSSPDGYTHTCDQDNVTNDPGQNDVIPGTTVEVTVTSSFDALVPTIEPFIGGIDLTTSQKREIFFGTTTG